MIRTFKNKGLKELFESGATRRIGSEFHDRIIRRLDVMDATEQIEGLNIPGFDFHRLKRKPFPYSIHVNGPWCLTFEWEDGDIYSVDFENYH